MNKDKSCQVITGPWYGMLITGIITMVASLILFNVMQEVMKEEDKEWVEFLILTVTVSGMLYFTLLIGYTTGCFDKYRYR